MKQSKILGLFLLLTSMTVLPVSADNTESKEEVSKPAPEMSAADKEKLKVLRGRIDKAREELNGSSWQVSYKTNAPGAKIQKDIFTFQDSVFKSDLFLERGFTSTNYTVSMAAENSDKGIYETMLSSKEGVVFLRGEWEKDNMSGRITEQLDGGKKILDYAFTTSARKAIPTTSKKEGDEDASAATDESLVAIKEGGSALVSKESPVEEVPAFVPGTTDESR